MFIKNHIKLDTVSSTNIYLRKLVKENLINVNTLVSTNFQEKGRGQGNNYWQSEENKNLLISFLYNHPTNKYDIYKFNICITLAVYDFLSKYFIKNLKIKWPNDLMVNDKKIGGILVNNIESNFKSIIGIGININQNKFDAFSPLATSFINEKKKEFNINILISELIKSLENSFSNYSNINDLKKNYLLKVYNYRKKTRFKYKNKEIFGKIIDINSKWEIVVESEGRLLNFKNGEIQMLF